MSAPEETNIEITAEKLVYGGDALARADGQVVLVPFVLPGESALVRVVERKAQYIRGAVEEVTKPSEVRRVAPCQHFGACGGCDYQHAAYDFQREQKVAILREVIQRTGKFEAPAEIDVIAGPEFEYRNRVQFHFEDGKIGYHAAGSRDIVDVVRCHLCSPKLQQCLDAFRRMIPNRRFPRFLRSAEVFTNETEVQLNVLKTDQPLAKSFFTWCGEQIPGLVPGAITYSASGFKFRVSMGSFFQTNRFLVDRLVESALQGAAGESALDLYSGVGLFSLPLSTRFARVTAIESSNAAWRDMMFNAQQANATINAVNTSAEAYLATAEPCEFVIADPPRAGLGKAVTRLLLEKPPARLHLVSCDPSTMARDLAVLQSAYRLESMTMVDLFPQTYHMETIARLVALDK